MYMMLFECVSILIGYIMLTKSLLCNVAAFIGMPYISDSSDIQSLFIWCGSSCFMTSCKCHKLHEGYFSVQERFCVDSNSEMSDPKQPSRRCGSHLDAHQLATSVWTTRTFRPDAHQYLETLNCSRLHPSGRNSKSSGHY